MRLFAPSPGTTKIALDHQFSAKPLLSSAQIQLFHLLDGLAQGFCSVLCKVKLTDFLQHYDKNGAAQIGKHSVDFLVCRKEDSMPMLGVEVEASVCPSVDQRERDTFVNMVFGLAAIPMVRVPVREVGDHEQLAQMLQAAWQKRVEYMALLPDKGLLARQSLLAARSHH